MPRAQAESDLALEAEAMVQPASFEDGPLANACSCIFGRTVLIPPYFSILIKLLVELDISG